MADNQLRSKTFPFTGKLVTSSDPAAIGDNFSILKNMRYTPNGIRGISGMSKINTTALSSYPKGRSAHHFKKTFPAVESHVLVQAENSAGTGAQVLDNTTTVPNQGDFSATAVHTDASGFSRGRFVDAPNGQLIYCNSQESLIWGGNETPNSGFIVYDPAGTFSYDYTEETTTLETDKVATMSNASSGIDSDTSLMLHLDNNVTDSAPTGHTVTNANVTFDGTTKVFGSHAAVFNGTNAKLTVPDHADFDFSGGTFTIDCWINIDDLSSRRPIFYQDAASTAYLHFEVQTDGALHFSIHTSGGSESVEMTSATGLISVDTWYHVALVEDGDAFYIFLDGTLVDSVSDTDRAVNYDQIVQIGYDATDTIWFSGYMDEYRVSTVARWTADFTPPNSAYSDTTPSYIYVASLVPLSGLKVYIGTANTSSGSTSVNYWDGSAWAACTTVSDGTSSGGVSFAQTGEITFDDTKDLAKIKHIEGKQAYWYQVIISAVDTTTTIYFTSVEYSMQQITDLWDGLYESALSCQFASSTGQVSDKTTNVYAEDYDSGNTASYLGLSGMTSAGKLYIGFSEPQAGLFVVMSAVNSNASALSVAYWNGESWVNVTGLNDGTSQVGKTLSKSGEITWNPVAEESEFKKIVSRGFPLYYYRLSVGATLGATVQVDYMAGIRAQESMPSYGFAFVAQDRVWLCDETNKDRNMARCSSSGTTSVWNGTDTTKIFFGDNTPLRAGARLYSQFGSSLLDLMVFFKDHETWMVAGSGPSDWIKFPASQDTGCVAPLTLTTIHLTSAVSTGVNLHVAIFQANDGIYMFDGRTFTRLSNDIENFFDANASDTLNPDMISNSVGFYDKENLEYHWLFASGSSTTLNREFVFSVKYNKWSEIVRSSELQCGVSVKATDGNRYTYGFIDSGYMERLENGTTMDGSDITYTVKHGDTFLSDTPAVETMIQRISMGVVAKTNTSNSINATYYVDTVQAENGGSFTLDMTDDTKRILTPTASLSRQKGVFHNFQWQVTTNDETVGFEPLYMTALYTVERTLKNR